MGRLDRLMAIEKNKKNAIKNITRIINKDERLYLHP